MAAEITTGVTGGVIYFRLNDPRYKGDVTKGCGLTGSEIDKNFNFLRGYDIEKGSWNAETKVLILERINGEQIVIALPIDGSGSTETISFEGSEFLSESGGTLSLVANGGEPYLITGFTECCEGLVEALNVLSEKIDSVGEEITVLTDEYDEYFVRILKFIDTDAQEEFNAIRRLINEGICDVKRSLETEIQNRKKSETKLRETVSEIVGEAVAQVQAVSRDTSAAIQNLSREIENITEHEGQEDKRIQNLSENLNDVHNELSEAIARETRNRKECDRNLRDNVEVKLAEFERRLAALSNNCATAFENIENRFQRISEHEQEQDERITALNTKIDENICTVNEKIAQEKRERVNSDRQLRDTITEKETQLNEKIENEARTREGADNALHGLFNNEVQERQRSDRRLENLVQREKNNRIEGDNNIKAEISIQRNDVERLIDEEKRARQYQDNMLHAEIANRITTVGTNIEAVKAYARWLYYGSAENLLLPCDERKWGIAIRDINEGEYAGRREIYLNLNPNDKFLSQDCNYLASYISLRYNTNNNHIELIGKEGIVASYIDADVFIQKGFLISADVETVGDKTFLVLNWENGSTTRIDVASMFEISEGNGIDISRDHTISVSIGENESFLTFRNGALVTTGIQDAIDTSSANLRANIEALISREVAAISAEISGISETLSEIERTMVTNNDFGNYTARTNQTLSVLAQNILDLGTRVSEQIVELRDYVDDLVSGISSDISEIQENLQELETKVVYLTDFNEYTANTESEIQRIKETVFEATEEITALTEDVSALTENLSEQNERLNEIDDAVSGLTHDVSKNSQDIETLFDIIESGGSGLVKEIVSRDNSISVEDEGYGVINVEVNSAPIKLESRDQSINIEEESGGTINIEVASAPVKIESPDDSISVEEDEGITNIKISQILNPEIEIL